MAKRSAGKEKLSRKEQNRLNQQAFRERKRQEMNEMRAKLAYMEAANGSSQSGERQPVKNVDPVNEDEGSRSRMPLRGSLECTLQFPTTGSESTPRLIEHHSKMTIDPADLSLSTADINKATFPYQEDDVGYIGRDAAFESNQAVDDLSYTSAQVHYNEIQNPSTAHSFPLTQREDVAPSIDDWAANLTFPSSASVSTDVLAEITSDYANAQMLAFKSAEWYARAAEVGIKLATTRHQACTWQLNAPAYWTDTYENPINKNYNGLQAPNTCGMLPAPDGYVDSKPASIPWGSTLAHDLKWETPGELSSFV
ncbi:hypothetical protein Q7P37_010302 [Cladosporium fusiforme]